MNDLYAQTRADRIKMIMFPELFKEIDLSHMKISSTIVQSLTSPTRLLKTAVVELLSLRDESEMATKAIPELVKLLGDRDETVVHRAAHMVYLLSKEGKSGAAIANNPTLIAALCSATKLNNEAIRRDVLAALSHISEHEHGRMHLFRSGGIPELVRMLSIPVDAVRHYAITTLHNLLLYLDSAKQETRACGGVEVMTPLLCKTNHRFLALLTDSLYLMLLDHPQSKLSFLSLNGPGLLISLLHSYRDYPKLVYTIIRCIRAISVCQQNEAALITLGALQLLGDFIEDNNDRTQIAALCAIRNLSDAATNEDNLGSLIVKLINIIANGDEAMAACAAGVLSNLTCNNARNKQTLCTNRGMNVLCAALEKFAMYEEVTEPTLCALRHCTARHAMAPQAQSDVRLSQILPVILELLSTMRAPVVKAALGLVRNLALLTANLHSLGHERTSKGDSVVTVAMDVINRAGAQLTQDPNAIADGVAMRELVEGAVSALHQLANDQYISDVMMNDHTFIDMLIKLLSSEEMLASEDELLYRELLGLLYQLSKSPERARQLEMFETSAVLVEALRSKNKAISTYASGVLKNLQGDKSHMYREDLETEIESALNGGEDWMHDGLEPELFAEMYHGADAERLDQASPWNPPPYRASAQSPPWFDTDL